MFIGNCTKLSSLKQWYCNNNCKYVISKVELIIEADLHNVSKNCFSKEDYTFMCK